jgi:hypothetical protein
MNDGPERLLLYVVMYGGGMVIAALAFTAIRSVLRSGRDTLNRSRGADRPEWAPGIWMCAHCRSTNDPVARTCAICRRPREDLARREAVVAEDVIPDRIVVPEGRFVALFHDPAAHADVETGHWRLKVGGQTAGVAALRDGALALLRAVEGTDTIALDVRGTGLASYRLTDVIARFEAPGFPLDVPCPEAGR